MMAYCGTEWLICVNVATEWLLLEKEIQEIMAHG
jgi:hypothetical protein